MIDGGSDGDSRERDGDLLDVVSHIVDDDVLNRGLDRPPEQSHGRT